jgi:hypothetical protein
VCARGRQCVRTDPLVSLLGALPQGNSVSACGALPHMPEEGRRASPQGMAMSLPTTQ